MEGVEGGYGGGGGVSPCQMNVCPGFVLYECLGLSALVSAH